MRQVKTMVMFRAIPCVLAAVGMLVFILMQPSLATKFRPKNAPNSNSSGGRRAASFCQAPTIATSPATSPTGDNTLAAPAAAPVQVPVQVIVARSDPPTLLVQLPATSARQAVVKLEDTQGNDLYYTEFPLAPATQATSVTQLPLPKTAVTLEPGQSYRWSLGLICNQTIDPNDPVFEGWL